MELYIQVSDMSLFRLTHPSFPLWIRHIMCHTVTHNTHTQRRRKMRRMDINDVDFWMNNDNLKPIKIERESEYAHLYVVSRRVLRSRRQ